ncbi:DUF2087 domain-containing protein [Saccharopolyspora shandongensis]|uniref:DUF2087 domain-containing protein n=1 Tax=Saccharopolyspora shandongensis TaxID=418495 RepID=UPI003F4CC909
MGLRRRGTGAPAGVSGDRPGEPARFFTPDPGGCRGWSAVCARFAVSSDDRQAAENASAVGRGRLTSIPGKAEVRSRVLAVVKDSFEPGMTYSEAKVNAICGEWFDDWVSLRRALVDEGLLLRNESGTTYKRV